MDGKAKHPFHSPACGAFDGTECRLREALGRLDGFRIQSELLGEFARCNFSKGNVSESHLKIHFDHGAASGGEFAQTLADHIDKLLLVRNGLGGLFDVVGFHGKGKWLQR